MSNFNFMKQGEVWREEELDWRGLSWSSRWRYLMSSKETTKELSFENGLALSEELSSVELKVGMTIYQTYRELIVWL